MPTLTVDLAPARTALRESTTALVAAVDDLAEPDLLGASRCHGWSRLDVGSHLVDGLRELLGGFACVIGAAPDVDAATYWTGWTADHADADPVVALMAQRRRTAAYARPSLAVAELAVRG